ncbi:hypothetical protein [Nocardia sp. NPDC059239]|uniref:hypothetical protein n=1 Tax=unclassified Nocardia TaxID=2637762 RepID=UPI0036A1F09B
MSDAVVAIAITLIALPLVDSARGVADSSTSKFLADNSYALPGVLRRHWARAV